VLEGAAIAAATAPARTAVPATSASEPFMLEPPVRKMTGPLGADTGPYAALNARRILQRIIGAREKGPLSRAFVLVQQE
jgi:hypothetical protein